MLESTFIRTGRRHRRSTAASTTWSPTWPWSGPPSWPACRGSSRRSTTGWSAGAREGRAVKYKIFQWALAVGGEVSAPAPAGTAARPACLAFKHRLADKLVYSKIKARLGGRLRFLVSGGAPLSRAIAEFFHACDILILEGYGLTETSAGSTFNRPERYKFGTVGRPIQGVEVRIAEDGEILLRGRNIMQRLLQPPRGHRRGPDVDGWFHTGDVGQLDADGFLTITDRKKDIIVTAGGKNIAPQNIENQLKASCPYVSQVVMLGDRRPFCVALVTINEETTGKWAREHGIDLQGLRRPRLPPRGQAAHPRRASTPSTPARLLRADQGLPPPRPRPLPGHRRADPQDEHQAQGRGEPPPGDSGRVLWGYGGADLKGGAFIFLKKCRPPEAGTGPAQPVARPASRGSARPGRTDR